MTGEAEPFESAHQKFRSIAVLGEDDELLVEVLRIAEHLAQLLKFGFLAGVEQALRLVEQRFDCETLYLQLAEVDRDGAA